jgi:hypothetical protein
MVGAIRADFKLVFPRQADWIKALIAYLGGRKELCLIIRVHPREFPNKRDGLLSEHAIGLRQIFATLPDNVRVNWPTDNVSLYDLANITDVFTNAWSSAGKEMAWLGLPVVLYSRDLTLYPADLNYVGLTEAEYFAQLERALCEGWSAERILKTYRWCALEYDHAAMDISDSFSASEYRTLFRKVFNRMTRLVAPYHRQRADCRKRAPRLAAGDKISAILSGELNSVLDLPDETTKMSRSEEIACLKVEVGRLIHGLYGGTRPARRGPLQQALLSFCQS